MRRRLSRWYSLYSLLSCCEWEINSKTCVCVCVSAVLVRVLFAFFCDTPPGMMATVTADHTGGRYDDHTVEIAQTSGTQWHYDHRHTFKLLGEWHTGLKHKMMPSLINQYFLSLKTCKHWLKTHRLPHFIFIHSYDSPLPDDEKFSLKTLLSKVRRVFESCFSSQYLRLP